MIHVEYILLDVRSFSITTFYDSIVRSTIAGRGEARPWHWKEAIGSVEIQLSVGNTVS